MKSEIFLGNLTQNYYFGYLLTPCFSSFGSGFITNSSGSLVVAAASAWTSEGGATDFNWWLISTITDADFNIAAPLFSCFPLQLHRTIFEVHFNELHVPQVGPPFIQIYSLKSRGYHYMASISKDFLKISKSHKLMIFIYLFFKFSGTNQPGFFAFLGFIYSLLKVVFKS